MKRWNFSFLLLFLPFMCDSCVGKETLMNSADFQVKQQIERRDSLYMVYTIKEWHHQDWYYFRDIVKMYNMDNRQFEILIPAVFYSPDKKKIIAWYSEKMPNATPIGDYYKNKICPDGSDTIYYTSALIGFRDDTDKVWQLYPLRNQNVECASSLERAIYFMERFYFNDMKYFQEYVFVEDKAYGGKLVSEDSTYDMNGNNVRLFKREYGYNLQDSAFWNKSLLWQIGARAKGLYNFQTTGNYRPGEDDTAIVLPKVIYPDSILNMYKK